MCTHHLHNYHHVTPNHNPRAWTLNEASLKKKSSGVINAFSYANVINAKLQSHYANRLFLEPLYKYSQLKSGISLAIFLFLSLPLSLFLYRSLSLGVEIIRKYHVKLFLTHAVCVFSCDGPGLWHYAACLLITGCLALERDREAGVQGKV